MLGPQRIILVFIFILNVSLCFGNKIDSIRGDKQVFQFIKLFFPDSKSSGRFYNSEFRQEKKVKDSLHSQNWIKVDIDGNGETDLLVFDAEDLPKIFAIISVEGKYKKVVASYWDCWADLIYPVISTMNNRKIVLLYNQKRDYYEPQIKDFIRTNLKCDTLIIKDGLFINYLGSPIHYDLEKIEIDNDGICEGDCPRIKIIINPITFENTSEVDAVVYSGKFSKDEIQKLECLFQYSNFSNLKDSFFVSCTDQTTTSVILTYNEGKVKKVIDYGSCGNFTLSEIYNIAFNKWWIN